MGHMDVIPIISDGFNVYLPIIMCFLCLATFLDVGTRVLHFMGIEQFMIDDELTADLIKEGLELVKREKNKKLKQTDTSGRTSFTSRYSNARTSYSDTPRAVVSGSSFGSSTEAPGSNPTQQQQTAPTTVRSSSVDPRLELLNDVEPVDYSSTWNQDTNLRTSATSSSATRANQPNRNIFDDV